MADYQDVSLGDITIPTGRRHPNEKKVKELAESIKEIGLLQPIGLSKTRRLIYGGHRFAACKLLRWKTIPATIHDLDDLRAELAELDENLVNNRHTAAEEARCLKRRKEIYLLLHPETKQGGDRGNQYTGAKTTTCRFGKSSGDGEEISASDNLSFAENTASTTGKSTRTVERAVKLAEGISDRVAVQLDEHPIANNKTQLGKLTALTEETQLAVLAKIDGKAIKTVPDALEALEITPPAKPDYGKCPVCAGTKWVTGDEGVICKKCQHPHGESTGGPDEERVKTQRQKTVKTVEALMREFDDLHLMCAKTCSPCQLTEKDSTDPIRCCKRLLALSKGWK